MKSNNLESKVEIFEINNSKDPRLKQVIDFLIKHYGKRIVDRLDIWQQMLDESADPDCEYPISISAAFENNKVIAVGVANQLDVREDKSIGFLAYSAPEQQLNSTTYVSEVVRGVEELVILRSDEKDLDIIGFFVESERGKEEMYNRIGYKILEGVKYWEPAQKFSERTGEALERRKPLTPMMKLEKGNSISRNNLNEVMESIMYFYLPDQKVEVDDKIIKYPDKAYEKVEQYFDRQIKDITDSYKEKEKIKLI